MAPAPAPPSDDARLAFALAAMICAAAAVQRLVAGAPVPTAPAFGRYLVDVSTAPRGEIEALPGVGPVLAARIAAAREERPFESIDDLCRVPGVGPATLTRLREFVRCGPR